MNKIFINNCFYRKRNKNLRRMTSLFIFFALIFALCSCSDNKPEYLTTELDFTGQTQISPDFTEQTQTSVLYADSPTDLSFSESVVTKTKVYATSPFREEVDSGEIKINEFGKFSGEYVEDGSNRPIENVAAIRVTNKSKRFLDFATITVKVNNETATFVVTGLPAGKCAWILEKNCMTISDKATFEFIDCTTSFSDKEIISASDKISIQFDGEYIAVSNLTKEKLHNVVIYYRNLHDDGNYLGGITYRVTVGSINANETARTLAGHYSEKNSEIIRIDF